ncbi:MAG: transposase [Isosphaeraceae bacterium]
MIREEFDVSHGKSRVSRPRKHLGRTPQAPITRAIQRDEGAITRRRARSWPGLKRWARCERRELVLVDESGFYLLPGVVKTYAPRARTPVLSRWQTRNHPSGMGGLALRGKACTLVRPKSWNGLHTIELLLHLGRPAGGRLLVIWDGSPIHRRAEVGESVADTKGAIRVRRSPAYAPGRNPAEWVRRHVKEVASRN